MKGERKLQVEEERYSCSELNVGLALITHDWIGAVVSDNVWNKDTKNDIACDT